MASHILKAKYAILDGSVSRNCSILCHAKNVKEIYYQYEGEVDAVASSNETANVPTAATPVAPITVAISAPSSGPAASIEGVSIKAIDILLEPLSSLPGDLLPKRRGKV